MIHFFRKIRESLLSKGKSGKYIKYAIGEIILVVIGILIALQINNWNEWVKDRKKEEKILTQIENNIENSIDRWEKALTVIKRSNNHYEVILASRKENRPYHDSLQIHFERAHWLGYNWTTGHSTASFEALKNEGFDIIVNDSLSNLIIDVFERNISRVQDQFERDNISKINNYDEFLTRNTHSLVADFNANSYSILIANDDYFSILRELDNWRTGHVNRLENRHIPEMKYTLNLIKTELKRFE